MSSLNKVTLIGRLGRDPEIRYTNDNKPIANINLATSESWKDQSGQKQEKTEWHRVVVFGKLAEIVEKYVKKGDQIYIEGKLQTRKWQDQSGQDKYTTEVVLNYGAELVMLGGRGGDSNIEAPEEKEEPQQSQPEADNDVPF